jgi:hypothetical protein
LPKRPNLFDSFGLYLDIYTSRRVDPAYKATKKSYNCFLFEHAHGWRVFLEGRQPEGVATVLDPEDAQEERVHAEKNSTPDEDCNLLLASICHPGDLKSKANGGERENAVCKISQSVDVVIFK